MTNYDAEEVRAQHIRDMGAELGPVFNALWKELAWVHAKWKLYCQLYAKSPERTDLLKRAADYFFGVVHRSLGEDVLLHLCRLTDEPQGYRQQANLTIKRLASLSPKPLKNELRSRVASAASTCAPMREWRNARGAHIDLRFALSEQQMPGISRTQIEAALKALSAVLGTVESHHGQAPTSYERVDVPLGDADSLIYYLAGGVRREDERLRRLRDGKPLPEDWKRENIP
jgi:hypothetical protein